MRAPLVPRPGALADEFRRNQFHRRRFSLIHPIVACVSRTLKTALVAHHYGSVPCPATGALATAARLTVRFVPT